jgi:hypothetical protein
MSEPREHKINVESGYGFNTRKPFVQVVIPRSARAPVMRRGPDGPVEDKDVFGLQMSPAEAHALALNILEAAEAALGDGFLLTFLESEVGLPLEQLAPILVKFRGYRVSNEPEGR